MAQPPNAASWLLFVRGQGARSLQAIRTARKACSNAPGGPLALTVIDLLTTPELAKQYRVIAIPTLLTLSAGTERRWVGDVSEQSLREHFEGSHGH